MRLSGRNLVATLVVVAVVFFVATRGAGSPGIVAEFAAEPDAPLVPTVFVADERIDVGTVIQGDVVRRTFQLSNTGLAPLVIELLGSSCACAVHSSAKILELQPGQREAIELSVDTARFLTALEGAVSIKTNDPVRPSLTLSMSGRVEPVFRYPLFIGFGTVAPTASVVSEVRVEHTGGGRVVEARIGSSMFRLAGEMRTDGTGSTVTVAVEQGLQPGTHRAVLVLKTSSPTVPEIRIPISVTVVS